jgi:hypothetical protein
VRLSWLSVPNGMFTAKGVPDTTGVTSTVWLAATRVAFTIDGPMLLPFASSVGAEALIYGIMAPAPLVKTMSSYPPPWGGGAANLYFTVMPVMGSITTSFGLASSFCSAQSWLVAGSSRSPSLWPFTVRMRSTLPPGKEYSTIWLIAPPLPSGFPPLP